MTSETVNLSHGEALRAGRYMYGVLRLPSSHVTTDNHVLYSQSILIFKIFL